MNDVFAWDAPETQPQVTPVHDGTNPRAVIDARGEWSRPCPAGKEVRPQWSYDLAADCALNVPVDDILAAHGLTYEEYLAVLRDPQFQDIIEKLRSELQAEGATFKLKAKLMADTLLENAFLLATDKTVDPRVRTRNIENIVGWAGHAQKAVATGEGGGFSFVINMSAGSERVGHTIEGELDDD